MIFCMKPINDNTKEYYVVIEAKYMGVYGDLDSAKHCTGALATCTPNNEDVISSLEEDYSMMDDNSEKRVVVDA